MFAIVVIAYIFIVSAWQWLNQGETELPPRHPGALPIIGHAHLLVGDAKQSTVALCQFIAKNAQYVGIDILLLRFIFPWLLELYLWRFIQAVQNYCLENGGVTHVNLGPQVYYVICDPDDYFTVMASCLEKNYFYRKILSNWVGEGLVTAPVAKWKRQQKLLYPAFAQHVVDGFIQIHNAQARSLVENLRVKVGEEPFELLEYIGRSALEANFLTAFGMELDETTLSQMETYMKAFVEIRQVLMQRIQNLWMHNDLLYSFTKLKKRQDEALKIIRALSESIINKKRTALQNKTVHTTNNGKRWKGFMDLILDLSDDGALSNAEITCQVDTMILAGYDTSSTTMNYACVMLGSHPEVQEKVYQELQEVFNGSDRDVEKEDLPRLVYLDAVLKEVGRLFPAAPVVARCLDKDVKLKNYTMPAGSNCAVFISGVNRHQIWGEDRDQFCPERWFDQSTLPDNASSFTGFSAGRRACIGKPYALTLMKITLAHLLRRYRLAADHTKLVTKLEVFLKPAEGSHVTLLPRS